MGQPISNSDGRRRGRLGLDPRQLQIVERLSLFGPGPPLFFKDACRVMNGDVMLDARTHTVAHALREVDSSIRKVLEPMIDGPRRREINSMSEGKHRAWIDELVIVLGFDDTDEAAANWWRVSSRLHERAHRDALAAPRPVNEEFRQFWQDAQTLYELITRQFASVFLATMPLIDELASKSTPTDDDMTTLRVRVPHNVVALDRFFLQLDGPGWLQPLYRAGYFESPEPPTTAGDGSVTYTRWPPGAYLVRMASVDEARSQVLEVALALETENPEAHERVTEAALAMPPADAARLVPTITTFLQSTFQWGLPIKAADLAAQLVNEGEVDAGLALMRSIVDGPRVGNDRTFHVHVLEESTERLFPGAGLRGIALLCELLKETLARESLPSRLTQDYSYMWRPALERGRRQDVRDVLVTELRGALCSVATANDAAVEPSIELLEEQDSAVFQRLALDLLANQPTGHADLIRARLTDRKLFEDVHYRREYTRLARQHFGTQDPPAQKQILAWIESGHGEDDPERRDLWQYRQLLRLGEPLPFGWQQRYEELAERFGDYQEGEPFEVTSYVGPRAPVDRQELAGLGMDDLLVLLRDWVPNGGWGDPTHEGLARLLAEVVATNPVPYASAAPRFVDVDPTYARALLGGLRNALREGHTFDWVPVLEFVSIALAKPRLIEGRNEDNWDIDPGWKPTRTEIADLLTEGFEATPSLQLEFEQDAWTIIRTLAEDPDPTRSDETGRGSGIDSATMSLNTVRGAAFHALMHFIWWRGKGREAAGLTMNRLSPEAAELLERHLDPAIEPTLTVRSVYGQWFPYLATVDHEWARNHVAAIFPRAPDLAELRESAWETYVTFNRAYENTLELLRDDYQVAIEALSTTSAESRPGRRDEQESLVDHLLTLYGHGWIELDDPLFEGFFASAPLELRGRAIEFVGLSLTNTAELDVDAAARLRKVWERRLAEFKAGTTGAEELTGFGWWFSSAKLDDAWSLAQLQDLLSHGGRVEPDHSVAERLAQLVDANVDAVLACLSLMIDIPDRRWFIPGSRDEIRTIISRGLRGDPDAQTAATAIVNRLAAQGQPQFAELLETRTKLKLDLLKG